MNGWTTSTDAFERAVGAVDRASSNGAESDSERAQWRRLVAELRERDADPGYAAAPVLDVYARISKNDGAETEKTDRQILDALRELESRPARLGEVLCDEDLSGWDEDTHRPDFETLLTRLGERVSQGALCWMIDRLTRQPWDAERLIRLGKKARKAGQRLVIASADDEYDLTKSAHQYNLRNQVNGACKYSDDISEKQQRKKQAMREKGRLHTGGGRGFGFGGAVRVPKAVAHRFREDGEKLPQVPAEQVHAEREAIAWGTQQHLDGVSLAAIAHAWNTWDDAYTTLWTDHTDQADDTDARDGTSGGLVTVTGLRTVTGDEHTDLTVRQILSRASNAGLIEHDGVIVNRAKNFTPIITEEQLEQLRALFASRSSGRPITGVNLCTGHFWCHLCGARLVSKARSGKYYPDGQTVRRYECKKCRKVMIDQRHADAVVKDLTIERLADPRHAEQVKTRSKAVADLDEKIAEAEQTGREVGARLGAGKITLDRHDAIMAPLDRRLTELREKREALLAEGATTDQNTTPSSASVAELEAQWGTDPDNNNEDFDNDADAPEELVEVNQRRRALIRQAFPLGLAVAPSATRGGGRFDPDRIKPIQPRTPIDVGESVDISEAS